MCRFPCQRRCVSAQRQPHPNVASNTVEFPGCDWWIQGSATKCCLLPTKPRGKQQPMRPNVPRESSPGLVGPPRQPRVAVGRAVMSAETLRAAIFGAREVRRGTILVLGIKRKGPSSGLSVLMASQDREAGSEVGSVPRSTGGRWESWGGFGEELVSCAPLNACPALKG